MSKSTKIELQHFSLEKALNGATLAMSSTGLCSGSIGQYVYGFEDTKNPNERFRYRGIAGMQTYSFDAYGRCSDSNSQHALYIVSAMENATIDNVATKGDDTDTVKINSLNPREEFAKIALIAILEKESNALEMDTAKIVQITEKAFIIAQSMLNTAADYRSLYQEGDTTTNIEVQPTDVSSTTDKILFNLTEQIKKYNDTISQIKNDILMTNKNYLGDIRDEIITIDDSMRKIASLESEPEVQPGA